MHAYHEMQKLAQQEAMRQLFAQLPSVMFPNRIAVMAAAMFDRQCSPPLVREEALSQQLPYAGSGRLPGRATKEGVRRVGAVFSA